jgi:RND family efflux transporter MFP subunit
MPHDAWTAEPTRRSVTPAEPQRKVVLEKVLAHSRGVTNGLACEVTAPNSFRIASHATAELQHILPVGSSVRKGDIVAKQDDTYLSRQIAIIKTDIAAAKLSRDYAKDEYQRLMKLNNKGLTSASELNNLKMQLDSSILKIERLQQELEIAQTRHSRLVHRAPFDSQVIAVDTEPGTQLMEGQTMLRLLSTQNKQLECRLPVSAYQTINALKSYRYDLDGMPLKLREIGQQVDAQRQELILYFDHPAKDKRDVLVGFKLSANMTMMSEQITKVPSDAVELDNGRYYTWRINTDNAVEKIEVKILENHDTHYIVESDLRAGDKLVVSGQQGLSVGQRIDIGDDVQQSSNQDERDHSAI